MKQIKLSDHTADQADQAQQRRLQAHAFAMVAYDQAVSDRRAEISLAKSSMREAWRQRRVFAAIASAMHWLGCVVSGRPQMPILQGASEQERVWVVGGEGEGRVVDFLSRQLDDAWTLVSGYRNARGEIDQVLVGPTGLFTLEVKHLNGSVSVDGDRWTADKYDNYGNLVERARPISDRGGRSPSRQLNESTEQMLQFLRKTLPAIAASRIVVLSHDKSALVRVSNPTVTPVVLNSGKLANALVSRATALSATDQKRVIELLQRDHAHHAKRRAMRDTSGAQA